MKKTIEAGLKAKVVLEAFRGEKTLAQISSEYGVHPNLVSKWKHELLKGAAEIFSKHGGKQSNGQEEHVENDWLKIKLQLLS
ncbi:MAG: hypothetical protein M1591_11045 [Deltaproteobacteria bacterium]|nr:hypothetical protein [Deltaproteobacteria bacterium]